MVRCLIFVGFSALVMGATPRKPPLTLDSAVQQAIANSATVKKAREELTSAQGRVVTARSPFFPEIYLEAQGGTYHDRTATPGDEGPPEVARDRNQYQGAFVIQQNLFSGFRDSEAMQEARNEVAELTWTLEKEVASVYRDCVNLYFEIQLDKTRLEATREIQQLRRKQLKQVQDRARVGRATELEVIEAQYALEAEEPEVGELEANIAMKTLQLVRLLGQPIDAELSLVDELDQAHLALGGSAPDLANLYEQALARSPELLAQKERYQKKAAAYRKERGKHLPKLDFELRAGTKAHLRNEIGEAAAEEYSGVLKITVPLFSGLESIGERRNHLSALEAMKYEETSLRETLFADLSQAIHDWRSAALKVKAETTNNKLATTTVSRAESLYGAGRATLQQVLDAYTKQLSARRSLAEAKFDQIKAQNEITYLVGASDPRKAH